MSIFDREARLMLKSIEADIELPLWQYHLFAPFLINQISYQRTNQLIQIGFDCLDQPLFPYTQQDVLDRWDSISLLSALSSKMDIEKIESFAILLLESLHFKAAPVRSNAAYAILEILNKIKNQSLINVLARRLSMLAKSDKSVFVRYYADMAANRLLKAGIASKFMFYRGENPLSGIESSKLFHRFIRLWCTGNIEFYQGDYKKQSNIENFHIFNKCEPVILNDFIQSNKIPLPLSYMQFLVDVANGGQLSRITQNLQLLHNDEWIHEDEPDPWQVQWVTLYPAKPTWVSIVDDTEFIPDELGVGNISQRFEENGDLKNANRFRSLITLIENLETESSLNFDYFSDEELRRFSFQTNTISRNVLKFYLWINHPLPI